MNYIHQLQAKLAEKETQIEQATTEVNNLLSFLHSAKFVGTESDGSRKDWISTSDVYARLMEIRRVL